MSLNQQLIAFLDGALSAEAEAELLHRLSVSPERRQALRSFMKQEQVVRQDLHSLKVPYSAEQKLWEKLNLLMPVAEAPLATIASQPTVVSSVATRIAPVGAGFWSRISPQRVVALCSLVLFLGLGTGFYAGARSAETGVRTVYVDREIQVPVEVPARSTTSSLGSASHEQRALALASQRVFASASLVPAATVESRADLLQESALATEQEMVVSTEEQPAPAGMAKVSLVAPIAADMASTPRVGDDGIKPIFHHEDLAENRDKTVIERIELHVLECLGRQYPGTEATAISAPLITNSSFTAYFQVLPHSEKLWAGIGFGTANVTNKRLFTKIGSEIDPLEQVLVPEYVHVQTDWLGAFAQYRMPIMRGTGLMFTGGYAFSEAGNMMIGEAALRFDVSKNAGFTTGLRGVRTTYDLKSDRDRARDEGSGSLAVPKGVLNVPASLNVELSAGLYFHF